MIKIVRLIIENVLKSVYQPFLFALILSVFVLYFVMYVNMCDGDGWKNRILKALRNWKDNFLRFSKFRRFFYLALFVIMILFKTFLNRELWTNPLIDVIGTWGLYKKDGSFTTEVIENIFLFIPLIFFLFFFLEKTSGKVTTFFAVMGRTIVISILFSLVIEMLQLFLRLGTWQLSDLFFNTIGGFIGGLIYWISAKARGL